MALFNGPDIVAPHDTFGSTTEQKTALGSKQITEDGRQFRYCSVAATDTVAGSLYQGSAPIANHLANTPPAVAIGATSFTYTPGATAGAANLYAEGYLQVDTAPGLGYTYKVKGHAAISSATAFTLNLEDAIQVALTTSSRVGLISNPWKNILVVPTTSTGRVIGISPCVIPASGCGYIQTSGMASCLINTNAVALTAPMINSVTTAGALDVWTTAAQATSTLVGYMAQVSVTAKANFVLLTLE